MKCKKSVIFIFLIICLFTLASVCASDVNETIGAKDNQNEELINENQETNDIVSIEDELSIVNDDNFGYKNNELYLSEDVNKISDDDGIEIFVNPEVVDGDEEDVARIDYSNIDGNITVLIDGIVKYNKKLPEYGSQTWITYHELKLPYGEYGMKINFVNETTTKVLYDGPFNFTYKLGVNNEEGYFDEYSDSVVYYEYEWNFGVGLPRDATGNLTVNFNGDVKELKYNSRGIATSSIIINGFPIGEYKIKVSLTNDSKYPNKSIEYSFYVNPVINVPYYVSVGETEIISVEFPKNYNGIVTVYNATLNDYDSSIQLDKEIGSASVVNGFAKIPIQISAIGRNYIIIKCTGDGNYTDEYNVIRGFENSPRFSSNINSNVIEVGNDVILKITAPIKSNYDELFIYVDGKSYKGIILNNAEITEYISKLSVGEHHIKLSYIEDSEKYSNSFYVTVKEKVSGQGTQAQPATQSKQVDKITLTLKKVKIKKSAKKLTIQATLKVNGKVVKGKIIKFKFNKKTYKARTNAKGVAKITVKKSVLKKLKKGKKVTYTATYGKITKKVTVKVK